MTVGLALALLLVELVVVTEEVVVVTEDVDELLVDDEVDVGTPGVVDDEEPSHNP